MKTILLLILSVIIIWKFLNFVIRCFETICTEREAKNSDCIDPFVRRELYRLTEEVEY